MDELNILREAWAEPTSPPPSARTGAKAKLMWHASHPEARPSALSTTRERSRFTRWLAVAAAGTVAAGALAFVVAPGSTATSPPPATPTTSSGSSSAPSAAQRILLAAAATALTQPAEDGAYWHLKYRLEGVPGAAVTGESWDGPEGRWLRFDNGPIGGPEAFTHNVGLSQLTFQEVQQLPTDPERLKAWFVDSYRNPARAMPLPNDVPPPNFGDCDLESHQMSRSLLELLYEIPAPPEVRAAAFRALAAIPGVTDLGAMGGGAGLGIPLPIAPAREYPGGTVPKGADSIVLVIDPTTAKLISSKAWFGAVTITAAEWTNRLPFDPKRS